MADTIDDAQRAEETHLGAALAAARAGMPVPHTPGGDEPRACLWCEAPLPPGAGRWCEASCRDDQERHDAAIRRRFL